MNSDEEIDELFDTDGRNTGSDPEESADDEGIFDDFEETEVARSTGSGTLDIGKKTYAIGLTWNSSSDVSSAKKEARAASENYDMTAEFYCVRNGDVVQYGLGSKALGHKVGMPALADRLCNNFEGSWLVVFRLGQTYYLAAARDGQVLTDCDRLYYDEEDARERFMSLMHSSEWDRIVAPANWPVDDAETIDLRQLNLSGRGCKLRQTNPTGTIILAGLVLAVIAGSAGGGYYYYNKKQEEARYEATQERIARENEIRSALDAVSDSVNPVLRLEEERQVEETPPDPPWLGNQTGPGTIIVCVDDILKTPIDVPGWDVFRIQCRNAAISMRLEKNIGTVPWAEHYFRTNGYPETDFSANAMTSTLRFVRPGSFVSDYGAGITTRSLEEIRRHLLYYFEELRLPIEWSRHTANRQVKLDRYYKRASFSFTTQHKPTEFLPILEEIPALVIDSIEFEPESGNWSMTANVFEKRATPLPKPVEETEE
ncbi:type 4b pilus protein PilO2 [Salipiger mucosus]|uniref:Putative PilO-like pilus assembly protein n=1 Tax=Salipiger mucosus DSM 16094 TaxID=1123237 RepID=S9RZX6_9RHOB|nr:type 4b pilus protein PilO2 [Salipiger mucosus]EPX83525.1 putative PilO-like pilus assembly protein [Salipiger mucosus DSM 16094]